MELIRRRCHIYIGFLIVLLLYACFLFSSENEKKPFESAREAEEYYIKRENEPLPRKADHFIIKKGIFVVLKKKEQDGNKRDEE